MTATMRLNALNILAIPLLSACLLAASLPAAAKDEPTPLAVDAGFKPAQAATHGFDIAEPAALKGIKRVAVPVFVVEFVTADNVSTQTSGFAAAGRASSSLYYKLLGVGEADFQAITDALYLRFLAELSASGLEVVPAAQFSGTPTYARLAATGSPAPLRADNSITASPPGLAIYGFARMGGGAKSAGKGLFSALADVGAGFSAVGAITDTLELGKELDASLIEARLRVNFVELADHNRGFLGRLASSASTSGKVLPSIDKVMLSVQNGPLRSTLTMKHMLTLDGSAFAEVREKPSTKADIAGAVAVGLLKLAIGSKDNSSSTEMEVLADAEQYRVVIGGGLGSAGSMLVARLAAERR